MGKRAATVLIAVVGFAAPITLYAADSRYLEPVTADAMPADEILTRVRALSLDPIGEPLRRGSYYIVHAYDRRGAEMRVVADVHYGDVISVTPADPVSRAQGPGTVGVARIIHIPAPGEENASIDSGDAPVADKAASDRPAPAQRVVTPRRRPFSSAAPTPTGVARSAPPPGDDDSPSPVYPTPRFPHEEAAAKPVAPLPAATAAIPPALPPQAAPATPPAEAR